MLLACSLVSKSWRYILSYTIYRHKLDITWYHTYQQKSWCFTSPFFFNKEVRGAFFKLTRKSCCFSVSILGAQFGEFCFPRPTKLTRVYCCFVACDVSTYQFLWHIERRASKLDIPLHIVFIAFYSPCEARNDRLEGDLEVQNVGFRVMKTCEFIVVLYHGYTKCKWRLLQEGSLSLSHVYAIFPKLYGKRTFSNTEVVHANGGTPANVWARDPDIWPSKNLQITCKLYIHIWEKRREPMGTCCFFFDNKQQP